MRKTVLDLGATSVCYIINSIHECWQHIGHHEINVQENGEWIFLRDK